MLAGDELQPSAKGKRVADGPNRTVIDGPFAETKELVAGYWQLGGQGHGRGGRVGEACPNPMLGPSEIESSRSTRWPTSATP